MPPATNNKYRSSDPINRGVSRGATSCSTPPGSDRPFCGASFDRYAISDRYIFTAGGHKMCRFGAMDISFKQFAELVISRYHVRPNTIRVWRQRGIPLRYQLLLLHSPSRIGSRGPMPWLQSKNPHFQHAQVILYEASDTFTVGGHLHVKIEIIDCPAGRTNR
jgi:hypothetical protein